MRRYNSFLFIIVMFAMGCRQTNQQTLTRPNISINTLIENLEDPHNEEVIVIAHRGDWRNAPENSIQAIQNCIDMGVDMVEIDVRETKDGQLVLMYDKTIDRTTTGKGFVKDWTLDSLKTLNLLDGLGNPTAHKIPTLEKVLLFAKDKILIALDKSYEITNKCYPVLKKTNTLEQVVILGAKSRSKLEREYGDYIDEIHFLPKISLPSPNSEMIVDDYLENSLPIAIEFTFQQDTFSIIDSFDEIRALGTSVWVNSLWENLNGGHDDEKAALDHNIYDWYIDNHINMIQTDRPALLLKYLRDKGLHK